MDTLNIEKVRKINNLCDLLNALPMTTIYSQYAGKYARCILTDTLNMSNAVHEISSPMTSEELQRLRVNTYKEIDARMRKIIALKNDKNFKYMAFLKWKSYERRSITKRIATLECEIIFHGPNKDAVKNCIMKIIGRVRIPKDFVDIKSCLMAEAESWCAGKSDGCASNAARIRALVNLRQSLAELNANGNTYRRKYEKEKALTRKLRVLDELAYIRNLRAQATMYGRQARIAAVAEKIIKSVH